MFKNFVLILHPVSEETTLQKIKTLKFCLRKTILILKKVKSLAGFEKCIYLCITFAQRKFNSSESEILRTLT